MTPSWSCSKSVRSRFRSDSNAAKDSRRRPLIRSIVAARLPTSSPSRPGRSSIPKLPASIAAAVEAIRRSLEAIRTATSKPTTAPTSTATPAARRISVWRIPASATRSFRKATATSADAPVVRRGSPTTIRLSESPCSTNRLPASARARACRSRGSDPKRTPREPARVTSRLSRSKTNSDSRRPAASTFTDRARSPRSSAATISRAAATLLPVAISSARSESTPFARCVKTSATAIAVTAAMAAKASASHQRMLTVIRRTARAVSLGDSIRGAA